MQKNILICISLCIFSLTITGETLETLHESFFEQLELVRKEGKESEDAVTALMALCHPDVVYLEVDGAQVQPLMNSLGEEILRTELYEGIEDVRPRIETFKSELAPYVILSKQHSDPSSSCITYRDQSNNLLKNKCFDGQIVLTWDDQKVIHIIDARTLPNFR